MRYLLFVTVSLALVAPAHAEEPLVKRVRTALNKGIEYLKGQQKDQGSGKWNWENDTLQLLQPGGSSCLAMLALLTAGTPVDDPVVKRGLPYIRSLSPQHTYVVGIQTMVLAEVGDSHDLFQIQKNVNWLLSAAVTANHKPLGQGGKLEGWSYQANSGNRTDNSNTQYALLGLWAGRQAGAVIDKSVWVAIKDYYANAQCNPTVNARGKQMAGWQYQNESRRGDGTLTMTAAGVSGLYIASLESNDSKQELNEETGVAAKCGVYAEDDAIAKGMRFLAAKFRFSNPPHTFYNVYGIERVGRLSGQRFIGDHDWYREGCELLTGVKDSPGLAQKPGGEWQIRTAIDDFPVISTSFAVLFLAKGRTPILLTKLAWDSAADRPGTGTGWNRKHNDARHLVEYSSRELFKKMPLAWQIFDPRQADLSTPAKFNEELSNLLQSPILYMNGHEAPNLTAAQKRLLRRYVDEGGFILAEACCGSEEFARGFRKLMEDKEVFGQESPLMPLSPTHPIWSSHVLIPASVFQGEHVPENKKIQAIERGCKTVVVFSPQPLAGYWEEARFMPKAKEAVGDKERGKLAYQLAGNIIAYATGLEPPKPRLDTPKILRSERRQGHCRRPLHDRAGSGAARRRRLAAGEERPPGAGSECSRQVPARRIGGQAQTFACRGRRNSGRASLFTCTAKGNSQPMRMRSLNMHAHLDLGATLFSDACCGAEAFDTAFREFAKKLYPDKKLEVIPANDFLYSEKLNGEAITRFRCRTAKADGSPEATYQDVPPMLEGIKVDGRWAVIYSRYDIGCALEKNKSSACKGYDPDSAMKLATAALLYSLKR